MKFALLVILLKIVEGKIEINVEVDINKEVIITYSGFEKNVITDKYIEAFGLNDANLKRAVKSHYNQRPNNVYLKSPTPWEDLYKSYNWEQVSTILQVKSARLRKNHVKDLEVLTHDVDNPSNHTITASASITRNVENSITNSWSKTDEFGFTQEIEYDLNVLVTKVSGTTGISVSKSWGKSEDKGQTVSIGTSSGVEIELAPGQSARAVLSATKQTLEVDIVYSVTLTGNVVVNFKKKHNGHHFYGPSISKILNAGGLKTEMTRTETINAGLYVDSSLKVFDKATGVEKGLSVSSFAIEAPGTT